MGPLAKIGRKTYILGNRAEADRDTFLHCNLGVVDLIQNGLGKHSVLFSFANDLFITIQLDKRKVVPEQSHSNRTAV